MYYCSVVFPQMQHIVALDGLEALCYGYKILEVLMGVVQDLEKSLSGLFKGLPQLPKSSKESLAQAWPWIALVFGVLQIMAAYWLWKLTERVEVLNDIVNTYSRYYTGEAAGLTGFDKTMIYAGLIVLVVDAVILLMAYTELKRRTSRGWDLLFLASLINVVYAVLTLFINGRGVGSFIFSLLGSAVGFYLLFQVRELYKNKGSTPTSTTTKA
jgi:hypothetical protein